MSFKRHLRAILWLDKLVDVLVVILGISIAFGIDNWAEGRKNEQAKQQYLVSLTSDLRKDSLELQSTLELIQTYRTVLDTLFALTYRQHEEEAQTIAEAMLRLGNPGIFRPESYTYRTLQQTGDMGLLNNDSLQISFSKLYDLYENMEQQQDNAQMIHFDYVVPFYFNYDSRKNLIVDPQIYFQPKLVNALFALKGNSDIRNNRYEEALAQIEVILRLIEKELNG